MALVGSLLAPVLVTDADAVVLCQRKNKVKLRPEACKGKETLVQDLGQLGQDLGQLGQDLGQLGTDVGTQTGRVDELFAQFRLECVGAPQLVKVETDDSFYFDNIECDGGCRTHDGNQAACEGAWAVSESGATSCFFFKNMCLPCADCGEEAGACTNACRVPLSVTCPNDPTRTVFVGPSDTRACRQLPTQEECEQAFHAERNGNPASCYWTGSECRGCGPNNENNQNCTNTCRTSGCADATRTTLVRCTNLGSNETACNEAWHLSGNGGDPASCYFNASENQCQGCGFPNELQGSCDNTCRP